MRMTMSDDQGYGWLQSGAEERGLSPLPEWKEVPAGTQERVLGVLRRLALSRVLAAEEGLGAIEREVGIGEDRALRLHLLLTCFEMLAREPEADARGPHSADDPDDDGQRFHDIFTKLLGDDTREAVTESCWIYRDEPLVAWDGLDQVGAGFSRGNGDELGRLTAARERWDELDAERRLREITAVMRAVMLQYTAGELPFGRTTHSVWGNVALLRKFSEAARSDRINLLSETAFESMSDGDRPLETFQGVSALLDGEELFVSRADLEIGRIGEWTSSLASWKPRADGGGEAVFAWSHGAALVVTQQPVAEQLEGWLREALTRFVATTAAREPAADAA